MTEGGWKVFFQVLIGGLRELAPAIMLFIYDLMSAKLAREEQAKRDILYADKIKGNHEKVDSDKRTDSDVVDAIASGSESKPK